MSAESAKSANAQFDNNPTSPFIICASGGKVVAQVCGEVFVVNPSQPSTEAEQSITFKPVNIDYPANKLLSNSITIDGSTLTYLNLTQPQQPQNTLQVTDGVDEHYSQTNDMPLAIGINESSTEASDHLALESNDTLHSALVIKKDGSIVYTSQKENTDSYSLESVSYTHLTLPTILRVYI